MRTFFESLERRTLLSAGGLGTTFGKSGIVALAATQPTDVQTVAAAQTPDNKTIVLGTPPGGYSGSIVLARFNGDGSIDQTFGRGGILGNPESQKVRNHIFAPTSAPIAMTVDRQGRIYVVTRLGLMRFQSDGTPDASFGFISLNRVMDARAIGITRDGTVWLGGSVDGSFGLLHLSADGEFETKTPTVVPFFSSRGRVVFSQVRALGTDDTGKIVAVGGGQDGYDVARFDTNGSLDQTFGDGGRLVLPPGGPRNDRVAHPGFYFDAVTFDSSGMTVAAGGPATGQAGAMEVAEFDDNGVLNEGFGNLGAGSVQVSGPASSRVQSGLRAVGAAVLEDGHILLSGTVSGPHENSAVTVRLDADGSPDAAFGSDIGTPGLRLLAPPLNGTTTIKPFAAGLIPRNDGTFLVPAGGYSAKTPFQQLRLFGVLGSGLRNAQYGRRGSTTAGTEQPVAVEPTFLGADGNGNFLVGELRGERQSALVRLTADGAPDTSFGTDGSLLNVTPVVVMPDGKFYAQHASSGGGVELLRYNADGTLDTTFGSDGLIPFNDGGTIRAAIALPDGSLIVDVQNGNQGDVVHRIDTSGRSVATVTFGSVTADATISALGAIAVSSDGQYVYAAVLADGFIPQSYVHRYDSATLRLDTSFGVSGTATTNAVEPSSLIAEPDGTVFLIGYDAGTALVRIDASGTVFQEPGIADVGPGLLNSMLLQNNGKIVVYPNSLEFGPLVLDRFNADGSADGTFGTSGQASLFDNEIQNYGPPLMSAALLPTGGGEKLLIASVGIPPLTDGGFIARIDL